MGRAVGRRVRLLDEESCGCEISVDDLMLENETGRWGGWKATWKDEWTRRGVWGVGVDFCILACRVACVQRRRLRFHGDVAMVAMGNG